MQSLLCASLFLFWLIPFLKGMFNGIMENENIEIDTIIGEEAIKKVFNTLDQLSEHFDCSKQQINHIIQTSACRLHTDNYVGLTSYNVQLEQISRQVISDWYRDIETNESLLNNVFGYLITKIVDMSMLSEQVEKAEKEEIVCWSLFFKTYLSTYLGGQSKDFFSNMVYRLWQQTR